MEDIVEELLGEIDDEHDQEEEDVEFQTEKGTWRIPARREVRALNDQHGWGLPEGEQYDTLGGLILHHAEDIPEAGTSIDVNGQPLVVREVQENRIIWVEFDPKKEG
jgi:CBS domain containing-hemolysin-like protein